MAITPVIISLDDVSTPELKRAAGRSGCPTTMVLAGHPAALLRCAERYKNKVTAAQQAAQADREERMKKGKDMESAGFVSDYGEAMTASVSCRSHLFCCLPACHAHNLLPPSSRQVV